MTIDEELGMLDDSVRRLKIEYDVYFGGGSKKPPADLEWRVQTLIKKYSDSGKLSYAQRFRYNSITQKYALFSDLWRQKLKIKEEGYRRPQDAMLGIQGVRGAEKEKRPEPSNFVFDAKTASDSAVEELYQAMASAREKAGLPNTGNIDSFKNFVRQKTDQIRRQYGCEAVEYTVEVQDGQVRLKAKAKK